MRLFVGGLTATVTEEELKNRFSAIKSLPIESVDIILREDGVCKGFGYINTAGDNEEAIAKLIKLFNGAKWRGKSLRVEKAKPSYLDRMKEDSETGTETKEEPKPVEVSKREPLSGIPNTLTIRKSKRKFLVVSETPMIVNQLGTVVEEGVSDVPSSVTLPSSTKKHRFIQPRVIHYDPSLPLPSSTLQTTDSVSKPSVKPSSTPSETSSGPVFESTIHLDSDSSSEEVPVEPAAPAASGGVVSFSDDEQSETKESMPSLRREWSEKRQEIDAKRARVAADDASGASESEAESEVDLQAETREYQRILAGVLGKPAPPPVEDSAPVATVTQNGAMGDLFEESAAQSFSLFNYLPEKEGNVAPVAQEGATVLEHVAPTAWYNDRGGAKSTLVSVGESVSIPRDFSAFFCRTRALEEVEKEWEKVRPGLLSDFQRKKKNGKKTWRPTRPRGRS